MPLRKLLVMALFQMPLVAMAADWPQFLGPSRDGASAEKGLFQLWTKQGPPLRWSINIGEGFASPVVAGKCVVLFHRIGEQEVVECFDTDKGKSTWRFAYATKYHDRFGKGDGPRSTPLISSGKVYALGADGM